MMKELTIQELEGQSVELLPPRETLVLDTNLASIVANNTSLALNAASLLSLANSYAVQTIAVVQ
jgi:hypothetical protein